MQFLFFQVQFVGIMVHAFQLLFIDCNYPRAFVWWIGMHAVMFFFLFKEFYTQAYSKRKAATAKADAIKNGNANGYSYQNGQTKHHYQQNGYHKYPSENGVVKHSTSASDYYMNGHIPTEIEQKIKSQ